MKIRSVATIFSITPAPISQNKMKHKKNNNEIGIENCGAFGRIAQPYSGAAPHNDMIAKLVRGNDFYNRFAH